MENTSAPQKDKRKIILVAGVIIVAVIIAVAVYLNGRNDGLGYATSGVVIMDDTGYEAEPIEDNAIALEFQNDAFSTDGKTFSCYLGNSPLNSYDMFVAIYADSDMTDQIFVSDLVRPGNAFESSASCR